MRITLSAVGVALTLASIQASALGPEDFEIKSTRDLVKVCSVGEEDPLYHNARAFCLGYLDATWDYHQALTAGEEFDPLVCPEPDVTRDQAIEVFLAWAADNPQALDKETPVQGVMRAASDKWPCPEK